MIFFKGLFKKEEEWPFEPIAKVSHIVDENGEPQLKLYPPAASQYSQLSQKDLILAMCIIGEYVEKLSGKVVKYSLPNLEDPQLIVEIKGKTVNIVIRTARYPDNPARPLINQLKPELLKLNTNQIMCFASVGLWPAGKDANGSESFFINFKGMEKLN
ncbi:MAG: hypothetical protein WCR55_12395 [Lentisphaerota bacterium]